MKHLMCLVLLVLVLNAGAYGQNEKSSLDNMRQRINSLEMILLSIDNELNQISLYSEKISKLNEWLQKESAEEQKRMQSRINFLENKKKSLEAEKEELQKDYDFLNSSPETWTKLKDNYETDIKILEGQVLLWKGIGISSGIVAIGTLTYLIINAVKDAIKKN